MSKGLRALVRRPMAERDSAISGRDVLSGQNDRIRHLLLTSSACSSAPDIRTPAEEQLQLGLKALAR